MAPNNIHSSRRRFAVRHNSVVRHGKDNVPGKATHLCQRNRLGMDHRWRIDVPIASMALLASFTMNQMSQGEDVPTSGVWRLLGFQMDVDDLGTRSSWVLSDGSVMGTVITAIYGVPLAIMLKYLRGGK